MIKEELARQNPDILECINSLSEDEAQAIWRVYGGDRGVEDKHDIKVGDHVTFSGVVDGKYIDDSIRVVLPSGSKIWIGEENVKAYRPMHKESEGGDEEDR